MRLGIGLAVLIALTGCTKQSEREEEKLEIVEKGRDNTAICEQKKLVAEAYLAERNDEKYQQAKLYADTSCMLAGYEPYNADGIDMNAAMLGGDNLTAAMD